ncbi:MAG TPA: DUF1501 domain-containing protein [Planctomycetota bacterium]|nr:DUF1501 domain-containing protein [Planctomycetota bacterium]
MTPSHPLSPSLVRRMLPRRALLRAGGVGLLGLTLPGLLRAEAAAKARPGAPPVRAKSVIFLFQFGGPSHLDTFDPKPDAPAEIRGPLPAMPSVVPGVPICSKLPRTARVIDKVTLIRSMTHGMKNHNSASYYALTGHAPPLDDIRLRDSLDLYPAYGSVVSLLGPREDEVPTFVAYPHVIRDGAVTPGQHASFLGKAHDPLLLTRDPNAPDFGLPELTLPTGLTLERLERRRGLQEIIDQQAKQIESAAEARGLDEYYRRALAMVSSDRVRKAFDLSAETADLRDAYGRHTYGQGCLLARRLVEAGVRFVTVYFSDTIGGQSTKSGGWDTHGFNNTRMYPIVEKLHLPMTDETLPTLLLDLDARGLLDETLVVWMGEFGRTPRLNENASRDHWPQCYTALVAGGGVRRGHVYGASDRQGAAPARDPVRPDDLAATMFHLLGIDPHAEVRDTNGRPLAVTEGKVIDGIIA